MFCTTCGNNLSETNGKCPNCEIAATAQVSAAPVDSTPIPAVTQPQPAPSVQQPMPTKPNPLSNFDYQSFLSFKAMITPRIIKFIYMVGAGLIALASLFIMFTGGVSGFFGGLFGGLLAQVVFRVYCETLMLFFVIHRELRESNGGR